MTLVLEIEYLAGVSFAAIGPDSPVPDWPPQPDRIFSALVATWAARGQIDEEAEALRWLETLPPPRIIERGAEPRTSAKVFVPPNDARTNRQKHAREVLPALRRRQDRRFPAARPNDPVIRLAWPDAAPATATLVALTQLARDTAYIGHSSSLTRCRFLLDQSPSGASEAKPAERRVYPGRFRELRDVYARFEQSANNKDRPQRGASVAPQRETDRSRVNLFADRWLLLEHVDGTMPDLRAGAFVAKTIRDTILSGYARSGLADRIPEVVSGHSADGAPSRSPHIAVIPLAFVGFPYADGSVLGYAVLPPRDSPILEDPDFRQALRNLAPMDEERGRRVLSVATKEGTSHGQAFSIRLSPSFESTRASLDPARYLARARTFATVTPIVLDRHLKERGDARLQEIRAQVSAACVRIGLPEPDEIVTDKHSAIEGAPSAYPSGRAPAWTSWRVPTPLASRQLTHAVIRFAEAVDGPVIAGAGRFLGLGLCRPLDSEG